MIKTITEETKEACTWCRGHGVEHNLTHLNTGPTTCRHCQGARYVVTKIRTTSEEVNTDALVDAVADRLAQRLKARVLDRTGSALFDGYFK